MESLYWLINMGSISSMPRIILFLLLLLLAACHSRISYPPGGYDYPKHPTGKDTELYYYPIKDKESRKDSMWDAKTYQDWLTIGEPNLSLRPMQSDVFRFIYGEALDQTIYIIRMTPVELLVRIGTPTEECPTFADTNRLDPLERHLIRILDKNYPLDEKQPHRSALKQHYLDSMGHLYPQLYDPAYYIALRNKAYPHIKPWYTFSSKTIRLSPHDFVHLISVINASGFWHLPYNMPCQFRPMDGWGYSLEANTSSRYNYVSAAMCGDSTTSAFDSACQELVRYAGLEKKIHLIWNKTMRADSARKPLVVQDVQLEDVKEPRKPRRHHRRLKTLPPN
jgi:hypothetical protein